MNDPFYQTFNNAKVNLFSKVFFVSVELSKHRGLSHLLTTLIGQQNGKVLVDHTLVFRALTNDPIYKVEARFKTFLVLLLQFFFCYLQQIHALLK